MPGACILCVQLFLASEDRSDATIGALTKENATGDHDQQGSLETCTVALNEMFSTLVEC